jgi:hypothetical protein
MWQHCFKPVHTLKPLSSPCFLDHSTEKDLGPRKVQYNGLAQQTLVDTKAADQVDSIPISLIAVRTAYPAYQARC